MVKEKFGNLVGVILFYLILVLGIILLNARMEQVNMSTNAINSGLISGN